MEYESSSESSSIEYSWTWTLTASKIEYMIKWSLLELSSNSSLTHHCNHQIINENENDKNPLQLSIAANNYSFDVGICELSKLIESNQEWIVLKNKLIELFNKDENDETTDADKDAVESELFNKFVNLAGLDEILSLDWDSTCYFSEKLIELIYD
jgi:hypothetical protein